MNAGEERVSCPACGGAGGGPFGRAGSAWDDEQYVCPRCKGAGMIALAELGDVMPRPGLAKTQKTAAEEQAAAKKRKATA